MMVQKAYRILPACCILIIQALFSFKYIARYFPDFYIPVSWALILCTAFLLWYSPKSKINFPKYIYFGAIVGILLATVILLKYIPIKTLNVDRWSVISSFWDAAFTGEYPYAAKSHMNNPPGPMPFYFCLALPFYLGIDFGWIAAIGLIIWMIWWRKKDFSRGLIVSLLMLSSLGLWWEVASRSNVFFNAVLVVLLIYSWLNTRFNTKKYIWLAIVTGLMLSTRLVFVIPLSFSFIYLWKYQVEHRIKLYSSALIAVLLFAITFLPFLWVFPDHFWVINPFIVQGEYLMPSALTMGCVIVCFIVGLSIKSKEQVLWASGIGLFGTIMVYFGFHLSQVSWNVCLHQSGVDISYFLLSLPFLMYSALKN